MVAINNIKNAVVVNSNAMGEDIATSLQATNIGRTNTTNNTHVDKVLKSDIQNPEITGKKLSTAIESTQDRSFSSRAKLDKDTQQQLRWLAIISFEIIIYLCYAIILHN